MSSLLIHNAPACIPVGRPKILNRKVGTIPVEKGSDGSPNPQKESQIDLNWGRAHKPTWSASFACLGIVVLSPLLVIFSWITLSQYQGSLLNAAIAMCSEGAWPFLVQHSPTLSFQAIGVYALWVLTQAVLYNYLPARLSTGQLTPAGHLLQYYTNGLSAWVLTHVVLVSAAYFKWIDPAWIAKNWAGLLIATNTYGFLLSAFAYVKAYIAPTHAKDRKFSGMQY
jgi:7-dehydrocholesterol reductase